MCSIKQINRPLPPSQKTLLRPQLLPPHTQAGRSSSASPSADPATRILLSESPLDLFETRFSIAPPLARDKKTIADPAQAAEKRLPCPPDLVAIVSSHETATAAVSIRSRTANLPPATNVQSHRPFRTPTPPPTHHLFYLFFGDFHRITNHTHHQYPRTKHPRRISADLGRAGSHRTPTSRITLCRIDRDHPRSPMKKLALLLSL